VRIPLSALPTLVLRRTESHSFATLRARDSNPSGNPSSNPVLFSRLISFREFHRVATFPGSAQSSVSGCPFWTVRFSSYSPFVIRRSNDVRDFVCDCVAEVLLEVLRIREEGKRERYFSGSVSSFSGAASKPFGDLEVYCRERILFVFANEFPTLSEDFVCAVQQVCNCDFHSSIWFGLLRRVCLRCLCDLCNFFANVQNFCSEFCGVFLEALFRNIQNCV